MARILVLVSLCAFTVYCEFDCIPDPRPTEPDTVKVKVDPVLDKDGLLSQLFKDKSSTATNIEQGWNYVILTPATPQNPVGTSILRVDVEYNPKYAKDPNSNDDKTYNELKVENHCIFDGSFYYFKKTFYSVPALCPEITGVTVREANSKDAFPVTEITNSLSDTDWAKVIGAFDALPEEILSRTGTEMVRGLKKINVAQWVVSRRTKITMRPYNTYYRSQVEANEFNKIYKCVSFGDHYYTIRYFNPNSVSKAENIAAHKAKKPSERVQAYIDMAKALKAVHDKNLVEGMLVPNNFKFDSQNKIMIEHSLNLLPIGNSNLYPAYGLNQPFYAKEGEYPCNTFDDLYLLALTIVGMEVGNFDDIWKKKYNTDSAIPANYFPVDNLTDPNQYLNGIVKGVLKSYGDADPAANAPVDGNLTSLILYTINKATTEYTDAQFIASLEKVQTALKAKSQRNLVQNFV